MRHGVVLEAVLIEPAHLAVDEHELARTWAAYDDPQSSAARRDRRKRPRRDWNTKYGVQRLRPCQRGSHESWCGAKGTLFGEVVGKVRVKLRLVDREAVRRPGSGANIPGNLGPLLVGDPVGRN